MRRLMAFLFIASAAFISAAHRAFADKRVALVVGNSYQNAPRLANLRTRRMPAGGEELPVG